VTSGESWRRGTRTTWLRKRLTTGQDKGRQGLLLVERPALHHTLQSRPPVTRR